MRHIYKYSTNNNKPYYKVFKYYGSNYKNKPAKAGEILLAKIHNEIDLEIYISGLESKKLQYTTHHHEQKN